MQMLFVSVTVSVCPMNRLKFEVLAYEHGFRHCNETVQSNTADLGGNKIGASLFNGGGASNGEDLRKAAMRELREETGVTSAEFLAEAYRFLFKFTGTEEEINLLGAGSEKPEFKEWSWRSLANASKQAVDFKKPVYEQVLKVFRPYFSDEEHPTKKEPNGVKTHEQSTQKEFKQRLQRSGKTSRL
ncbi:Nudix hydrolase 27 [Hibiscus syriacus]|uniref:Nudix hydrolase 27 n=1 Tax=Hibiscus syriacus TaxID=106335 RepID=A0A6A3CG68_HIBSY|nr:Nudix hydrolase 27 [Hibiscus syriacus]